MDPDMSLAMLFENRALFDEYRNAANCSATNTYSFSSSSNGALSRSVAAVMAGNSPLSTDEEECCYNGNDQIKRAATMSYSGLNDGARLLASVEQISEAMRSYVLQCIGWINTLFYMANVSNVDDKVTVLKNSFAAFCTFEQATQTARFLPSGANIVAGSANDALHLCNGRTVPRDMTRQCLETNLLANNMVARILDEVVFPLRRVRITEQERVALTALIILEGDCRNVNPSTSESLFAVKDKIQSALFQHICERIGACTRQHNNASGTPSGAICDIMGGSPSSSVPSSGCSGGLVARASLRFANILLLLPSVAKVAAIYYENAQLAKMFGRASLDPLLTEIFLDASASSCASASTKPGGGYSSFCNDEPSYYDKCTSQTTSYFSAKPLTINCDNGNDCAIYGKSSNSSDAVAAGTDAGYGAADSSISAPNSASHNNSCHSAPKMCFDATTQTLECEAPLLGGAINHAATTMTPARKMGDGIITSAGAINYNARAYSDSGRYTHSSSDYGSCQERQHYTSGDSCISVGSLSGNSGRAIGLMDANGSNCIETIDGSFELSTTTLGNGGETLLLTGHGSNKTSALIAVAPPAADATTTAAGDFAGEDDAAQMNTIITMGLDLADEHSRNSTQQRRDHERHSSGVSSASHCAVEPISPPQSAFNLVSASSGNDATLSAFKNAAINLSATNPGTVGTNSALIAFDSQNKSIGIVAADRSAEHNSAAQAPQQQSMSAFDELLRGISGNTSISGSTAVAAVTSEASEINGYGGSRVAQQMNQNLYVSYSQLHHQMAQQHHNTLNGGGSMATATAVANLDDSLQYSNYNNIATQNDSQCYSNSAAVVQQFLTGEQQQQQQIAYGNLQQQQQQIPHEQQQQIYQQFFNTEQLLLHQQQQHQRVSQMCYDYSTLSTASNVTEAAAASSLAAAAVAVSAASNSNVTANSYPLSVFKFA